MRRVLKDGLVPSLLVLAGLAAVGLSLLLLFRATHWGAGIAPDSVVYLETARGIAAGEGLATRRAADLARPGHHPPLYPALLAGAAALGAEPAAAARGLGSLLLLANAGWVGLAVRLAAPGSAAWPALAAALFALSPSMLSLHAWALSEPLFVFFTGVGLLALARHLERPRRGLLTLACACAALACLDRYAGVALVATGALALFEAGRGVRLRRLVVAFVFSAAAALPLLVWSLSTGVGLSARRFDLHPIDPFELTRAASELSRWLLLDWLPRPLFAFLLLAALAGFAAAALRRWRAGETGPLHGLGTIPALYAAFGVVYVTFLVVSISVFDAHTRLNSRVLAPLLPALVVVVFGVAHRLAGTRARVGLAGLLSVFLLVYGVSSAGWAARSRESGVSPGFATPAWRDSELMAGIRALPASAILYSNAPDAIRFHTGRVAHWLPQKWSPVDRRRRDDLPEQLASLRRDVERNAARIAWFDELEWRSYLLERSDLALLPLRDARYRDGALYEAR